MPTAMLLFGQEVHAGDRDDMAVFWANGDDKRAIVDAGYGDARTTLERILRKFDGGYAHYEALRAKMSDLAEPGRSVVAVLGSHSIGLMRPYLFEDQGDEPYVVCRGSAQVPKIPVLCGSRDAAQAFAKRAIRDAELSRDGWCAFTGERLKPPFEQLFVRRRDGQVILRSELEEALNASRQREREKRLAPERPQSKRAGPARRGTRPAAKRTTLLRKR